MFSELANQVRPIYVLGVKMSGRLSDVAHIWINPF